MDRNEILLEKTERKRGQVYYYFRYDGVPRCVTLLNEDHRLAKKLAHDWYKELEQEEYDGGD